AAATGPGGRREASRGGRVADEGHDGSRHAPPGQDDAEGGGGRRGPGDGDPAGEAGRGEGRLPLPSGGARPAGGTVPGVHGLPQRRGAQGGVRPVGQEKEVTHRGHREDQHRESRFGVRGSAPLSMFLWMRTEKKSKAKGPKRCEAPHSKSRLSVLVFSVSSV